VGLLTGSPVAASTASTDSMRGTRLLAGQGRTDVTDISRPTEPTIRRPVRTPSFATVWTTTPWPLLSSLLRSHDSGAVVERRSAPGAGGARRGLRVDSRDG